MDSERCKEKNSWLRCPEDPNAFCPELSKPGRSCSPTTPPVYLYLITFFIVNQRASQYISIKIDATVCRLC